MKKVFSFNEGYTQNINEYTKKDGIFAILLFFLFVAVCVVNAVLYKIFSFSNDTYLLIGVIQNNRVGGR